MKAQINIQKLHWLWLCHKHNFNATIHSFQPIRTNYFAPQWKMFHYIKVFEAFFSENETLDYVFEVVCLLVNLSSNGFLLNDTWFNHVSLIYLQSCHISGLFNFSVIADYCLCLKLFVWPKLRNFCLFAIILQISLNSLNNISKYFKNFDEKFDTTFKILKVGRFFEKILLPFKSCGIIFL